MSIIKTDITIKQPVKIVFDYVITFDNNHKWQASYVSTQQIAGNGVGIGSTYKNIYGFLGFNVESISEIIEFEPNSMCTFKLKSKIVSGKSSLIFEDLNGFTKVTAINDVDFTFFKLAGKVALSQVKKQLKSDLKQLKKILEKPST